MILERDSGELPEQADWRQGYVDEMPLSYLTLLVHLAMSTTLQQDLDQTLCSHCRDCGGVRQVRRTLFKDRTPERPLQLST